MKNDGQRLYSVLLELQAQHEARLSATMGHQIHAMFHQLLARVNPDLSFALHHESKRRPFTLSPLQGGTFQRNQIAVLKGQTYHVRVTLLDDGTIWDRLSILLLEARSLRVQIGEASFTLTRLISTPAADPTGWARRSSWQELVSLSACHTITLSFASPTAFNMHENYFALVPEPLPVWESLTRSWNSFSPAEFQIEQQAVRDAIRCSVTVGACSLSTHTLHYPKYTQKGFTGTCTYHIAEDEEQAAQLTCLAAFARFAGVGYKTTMGMGQTRVKTAKKLTLSGSFQQEAEVS
jgi:CRISPR-associated endoribonuclease Cas6